ncbi:uncharacterized protein A1O5_05320 [Cladophialophora psammophila CBS 110553]|uniref:Uncharacterized protein n=1 Tax=Cladophialophora psammophila CBS 110553 TaxID=1182543 RepID=W9WTI4_9EURO|nr:uncharacterized protein A1O5_05320 [Cladophialophora psammophila CBS 110553]EXJ71512.1 hypothetical protein A1O5_05320 [Cladophialophora psammophila CBS 110553]
MLISRLQYRFALVATSLVLFVLGLLYKTKATVSLRLQLGNAPNEPNGLNKPDDSKAWIYSGPEAEDKAVILAKVRSEDVNWVFDYLQECVTQHRLYSCVCADEDARPSWKQAIYYMDEPNEGMLHPPLNKGREAMAYLTFIIDHYHVLPSYMVFVHPHLRGWPEAWHTDSDDHDQINYIRSLRLEYLEQHGYANMRCIHDPGCPAEIQVDRQEDHRTAQHAMREAWPYMFGGNSTEIPKVIAQPCCSQFAISKTQALKRSKADYEHYRQWLLDTPLDDATSGRVFEYLWHVIFGQEAVRCPPLEQCRCEQFGRC